MPVFIAADHRGFELKNKLIEYLQEQGTRVEDFGNYQYDPIDDYVDFARKVGQAVQQDPLHNRGIVICGSGIGVSIATNRLSHVYCGVAFNLEEVKHGRQNDHINALAIASDYTDFETAKTYIDAFLQTEPKNDEKYLRRVKKLDQTS
jgi:ribose 5-phosphate isomerase B